MRTQAVLLAVPSMAMAVVGLALFGPGAIRPFDGARLRGGPTEGLRRHSFRVTVLERFRGVDSTRNIGWVAVRARTAAGEEASARCRTLSDGACDVDLAFSAPVSGPLHAVIVAEGMADPTGAVLAKGDVFADPSAWGHLAGHPARVGGKASGDFAIEVHARRGVFAAPFRDELVVGVRDGDVPLRGARVTLRTDAADLDAPNMASGADASAVRVSSDRGEVTFGVAPRMHNVDVAIAVDAAGRSAAWHGVLPVIPGAIWLDPASLAAGKIRVVAPVPRDVAYATLATSAARLWGGAIALTRDVQGFAAGEIAWPDVPRPIEPAWLTLASDPVATGSGTVGWPVSNEAIAPERPFRDLVLLDGMPFAEHRDRERRNRARLLSAVALGAAAVLEGVLLAQRAGARGVRAWAWTVIAIATVALAFAAIGVVVMWKTSA